MLILAHSDKLADAVGTVPANQQLWILWPYRLSEYGSNRLLSIFSDFNWLGNGYDLSFRQNSGDSWVSNNLSHLQDTGYFKARSAVVGHNRIFPVSDQVGLGSVNKESLLLASDGSDAPIRAVSFFGPWPAHSILVYEATGWTDAIKMSRRVETQGGRAIIAEIPDGNERRWGRMWLSPVGWPNGYPVSPHTSIAGLIDARDLGKLVLDPSQLTWSPKPACEDSIDEWFPHVDGFGRGALSWVTLFLVFSLGCAVYCIIKELKGPMSAVLTIICGMAPVSFMVADNLARYYGIEHWWILFAGACFAMSAGGFILYSLLRKPFQGTHTLFWTCLVGFIVMGGIDPKWTLYSSVFSINDWAAEGMAIGFYAVFLTGIVAFARNSKAIWVARGLVLILIGLTFAGLTWIPAHNLPELAITAAAWIIGEGWFRWPLLIILAVLPRHWLEPIHFGLVWAPVKSYENLTDVHGINVGGSLFSLATPEMLLLVGLIGATLLFGDRFLFRQLKLSIRKDPRVTAFGLTALSTAVMGFRNPPFWSASIICGYALLTSLFFDAVWSL